MKIRAIKTSVLHGGIRAHSQIRARQSWAFRSVRLLAATPSHTSAGQVTLSQYVPFLPDLVARTALQDVRLQDLQAVAERKRHVWADTWKATHANGTVDLAAICCQ